MKKFKNLALSLLLIVGCLSTVLFTGCLFGGKDEAKIEIYESFRTEYLVGQNLDITGGIIKYTNEEGKESLVPITTEMVSNNFSSETEGTRSLIVTYEGLTLPVSYTISCIDLDHNAYYYYVFMNIEEPEYSYIGYIKISENGTMWIIMGDKGVTTPNLPVSTSQNTRSITCTKSYSEGKAVYSFIEQLDSISNISVLTENNIVYSVPREGNTTESYTFTKLVTE